MRRLYEWKYMNPPNNTTNNSSSAAVNNNTSATNYPSQEERYKKLLAQIQAEGNTKITIKQLTDRILEVDLEINPTNPARHRTVKVLIVYKPYTSPPEYVMTVGSGKPFAYTDWSELLEIFEVAGIIDDAKLCESITNSKIPSKLYHATYRQFLNSIKEKGLGATENKMWSDSKSGVVYLADDPWVAESYAEESEWLDSVDDPDSYIDNIIILEIDTSKLDSSKLYIDENVLLDADEENSTWEYHGIIPYEAINIFTSSVADDFKFYDDPQWD